jgi:hypothetical protein
MNIVAIWFGIIERQAIHRGAFGDVRELTTAIRTYITGWLQQSSPPLRLDPRPEEILKKANRRQTSNGDHHCRSKWRSIL